MAEIGSGSGSSYPGSLDSDASLEVDSPSAGKTKARAAVVNDLASAIIALQTELGTDPAGTLTNVKTFLQTEHETSGAHKDTKVVNVSGIQTITGSKTFANLTISGILTVSGTPSQLAYRDAANTHTASPQKIKISPDTIGVMLTRVAAENFQIRTNDDGAGAQEDATKPSWAYAFNEGATDRFAIYRRPAGGAFGSPSFAIDNTGKQTAGTVPLARLSAADANAGYPQSGTGGETLRTIRGRVNADGTIADGSGFTVSKGSAGNYTINITTAFSAVPTATASHSSIRGFIDPFNFAAGSFDVQTWNVAETLTDAAFTFIVVGPA